MKLWHLLVAGSLTISLGLAVDAQTTKRSSVIYVPKVKGQAKQRTDGATRGGVEAPPPVVRVITPQEASIVATDQPVLYWSLDKPTKYGCDVVVKTLDDEPIYAQHYDGVTTGGLQAFDLSKGTKKLEAGKDYRFVVLITVQPTDPASDIESSGTIRFDPPPADLAKQTTGTDRAAAYAGSGYFVDAVTVLAKDDAAEAKQALNDLLEQAKLK